MREIGEETRSPRTQGVCSFGLLEIVRGAKFSVVVGARRRVGEAGGSRVLIGRQIKTERARTSCHYDLYDVLEIT